MSPSQSRWQIALRDGAEDVRYAQQVESEPPATVLRVVRFFGAGGSAVALATVVDDVSEVGATGDGQDEATARTMATTLAVNLVDPDISRDEARALLDDALSPDRWESDSTVAINGELHSARTLKCRPNLWALYLLRGSTLIAAGLRKDPRHLTLEVTGPADGSR